MTIPILYSFALTHIKYVNPFVRNFTGRLRGKKLFKSLVDKDFARELEVCNNVIIKQKNEVINTSYVEHKYYIYETEIIFFVNDDVVDDLFGF